MNAVLVEAISANNLPLTILLGLIALYWIATLVGLMDFDALDGFLGLDDSDSGADGGEGEGGFLSGMLKGIGLADAPVMFILTLFSLFLWGGNVLGNIYFNPGQTTATGTVILAVAVVGAFLLTRLLIRPLRPLMRLMRDTEKRVPIAGLTGTVRSLEVTNRSGQVEVERDGATILLHARVGEGHAALPRGTKVLVVMEEGEQGAYLVRPLESDLNLR
jgi:HAMP domain-containing protein